MIEEEDVSGKINTPGITNPTKREILTPLYFVPPTSNIKNNILLDKTDDLFAPRADTFVDSSYVEHFLTLEADHEIDRAVLADAGKGAMLAASSPVTGETEE